MPIGPPDDPDRFDDFEHCVSTLSENMPVEDAEAVCGAWQAAKENDAMTDTDDEPQYRHYFDAEPISVETREVDDESQDGIMSIRMPIASTGVVRNEGDEPLTRDEISGMARQINEGNVGVFPSHGSDNAISGARYSPFEKLGVWRDAEVDDERAGDDTSLLIASAEMPDPNTLPDVGRYRESLGILKEQAKRGIPLSASIGWREAEDMPGGVDLMETSIVGIPADPRTVMQDAPTAMLARAAVDAGADPEAFVDSVRAAVMGPSDEPGTDTMTDETDEPPETVEHHGRTYHLREEGGTDPDDAQATDDDEDEDDEEMSAAEFRTRMLDLQEQQMETLDVISTAVRQEDDDEEEDEEDDDDDEDMSASESDEPDEEQAGDDPEEEQAAEEVADLRAALDKLREGGVDVDDVELPEPDAEQSADADEPADTGDDDAAKRILIDR